MKPHSFIALYIGTDFIRMGVFALRGQSELELLDYGAESIASDPAMNMAREAEVASALKRLLNERKPSARTAVICMEGDAAFSRLIKLPPVAPEKVSQTIRHEAVQNIPFPIDEVVWDAHVINASAPEPEVLLVAVKADMVEGLVHAVAANGLSVEVVDVAPAALLNAARRTLAGRDEATLLVDAGGRSINLVFIDGDRLFFRTFPVPRSAGERLVQEIERSMTFYRNQQAGRAPQRILLTGGLKQLDGAESRLGMPVEVFDALQGIRSDKALSADADLAVLVGMGLRQSGASTLNLDLVPPAHRKARETRRKQPLWLICEGVLILTAAVWIWGLHKMAAQAKTEYAGVQARVESLEEVVSRLAPLESRIEELNHEYGIYRKITRQRTFWVEVLADLRNQMPEGMFLLSSDPIRDDDAVTGIRVNVVSYLDKEEKGADVVLLLRDRLRSMERFSDDTRVHKRPTKKLFTREFSLDVLFAKEELL